MPCKRYDIIVVGGGINGVGIAVDAVGRGLTVGLFEEKDFASATSSASSKLIHGGLRYLENYEFKLVASALSEREVLLKKAPHIAWPLRFRLPHQPYLRPAWMIRAGLFLYDRLAGRQVLAASEAIDFRNDPALKPEIMHGFEYSDAWVDDARLVMLNAMQAKALGAEVKNYCGVVATKRHRDYWEVTLFDQQTQTTLRRECRTLINATGPWVTTFIEDKVAITPQYQSRMVKGSHIVVPSLYQGDHAFILQNSDERIVFVIPYLNQYSLIGTTDIEYCGDPREVNIDESEQRYLLDIVNSHFTAQTALSDIVWSYSGVRPLIDDQSESAQTVTRDYRLVMDKDIAKASLMSVYGGKLTTYRKLAEEAVGTLKPEFPCMGQEWTAAAPLPGGEAFNFNDLRQWLKKNAPWLNDMTVIRYIRQFGSKIYQVLDGVVTEADMGQQFACGVYQIEIDYFIQYEFAYGVDDILWRRTKLGLSLNHDEVAAISQYVSTASVAFAYVSAKANH